MINVDDAIQKYILRALVKTELKEEDAGNKYCLITDDIQIIT